MTTALAADPSSHVGAALQGWQYPVSQEWLLLRRLTDSYLEAHTKRPHPTVPTPWDPRPKQMGTPVSREEFHALVARHRESNEADEVVQTI